MTRPRFAEILGILLVLLTPIDTFAQSLKVTLLGTGHPYPTMDRFGPSTLIEAGKERLLIDCGRGVSQRLWQMGIPLSAPTAVFLTHLHSDHIVGIPDLLLTGWLPPPFGRRTEPFRIWGPRGTKEMMSNLVKAFQWDIRVRAEDEKLPPQGVTVLAEDVAEGVVYRRNGVKVTAFDVDHGPALKPALGYRIDYDGRSVVISGDTRFNENLIRFAKGADVVVHEVAMAREELLRRSDAARRIIAHHTLPQEAGAVFARVKPKLAVYSHVALLTTEPGIPAPTISDLIEQTRRTYSGRLEVGEDLMSIDIGETVEVHRAVATPAVVSAPSSKDEEGVRRVVERFQDYWNRHDMEAFAALFAENADFVNVRGARWVGRKAIEDAHVASHSTVFKNSRLTITETSVRFLAPEAAVARSVWKLAGHTSRDGRPASERTGILTNILERREGHWEIAFTQNTDIVPSE